MRSAVVGGSGFIGSRLCARLQELGDEVLNIDPMVGLTMMTPEFESVLKDFKPITVYDLAAYTDIGWCIDHPVETWQLNVAATAYLKIMARMAGARQFVFMSSAAVYGGGEEPFNEDSELQPRNIYGQSKAQAEQILRYRQEMTTTILRLFNPIGPNANPTQVLPRLIRAERTGTPIKINDFHTMRDYIWIDDVIEAIVLATGSSGVYNIASGQGTTIEDLRLLVEKVTGREVPYERTKGDLQRNGSLVADITRLKSLGWVSKVSLEEGIRRLV